MAANGKLAPNVNVTKHKGTDTVLEQGQQTVSIKGQTVNILSIMGEGGQDLTSQNTPHWYADCF